ncbi:hypothetical protein R3P38DRAFT_3190086 [Favolaschia claudopus]|uniref:Uncharacterized protein n=1 Tax=Favolaschia claudopus TaxID=2862362 RepID=A0AAW0BPA1_9AGAR
MSTAGAPCIGCRTSYRFLILVKIVPRRCALVLPNTYLPDARPYRPPACVSLPISILARHTHLNSLPSFIFSCPSCLPSYLYVHDPPPYMFLCVGPFVGIALALHYAALDASCNVLPSPIPLPISCCYRRGPCSSKLSDFRDHFSEVDHFVVVSLNALTGVRDVVVIDSSCTVQLSVHATLSFLIHTAVVDLVEDAFYPFKQHLHPRFLLKTATVPS